MAQEGDNPEGKDESFDALFAEAAKASDSKLAPPEATDVSADDDEHALVESAANPDPKPATDSSEAGQGADRAGASAAQPQPKPADGKAGAKPAEQPAQDIWATATKELREAHERDLAAKDHRYQSDVGRQTALQRRNEELSRELNTLKAQPAAGAKPAAAPLKSVREHPKFKSFAEDYPDIAESVSEMMDDVLGRAVKVEKSVSALATDRQQQQYEENETVVAEAHPDWEAVTESRDFATWLQNRPPAIRAIAERNGDFIVDPVEAIELVGMFKAHQRATSPNPQPAADPAQDPKNPTAARRKAQLESARVRGSSSPPALSAGVPSDFDGAFDHFAKRLSPGA